MLILVVSAVMSGCYYNPDNPKDTQHPRPTMIKQITYKSVATAYEDPQENIELTYTYNYDHGALKSVDFIRDVGWGTHLEGTSYFDYGDDHCVIKDGRFGQEWTFCQNDDNEYELSVSGLHFNYSCVDGKVVLAEDGDNEKIYYTWDEGNLVGAGLEGKNYYSYNAKVEYTDYEYNANVDFVWELLLRRYLDLGFIKSIPELYAPMAGIFKPHNLPSKITLLTTGSGADFSYEFNRENDVTKIDVVVKKHTEVHTEEGTKIIIYPAFTETILITYNN